LEDYSRRIAAPKRTEINTRCHAAKVSTMKSVLGEPRAPLGTDCQNDHASEKVKHLLETRDLGPFRATGIRPFLDVLQRVFARVKDADPELFGALGTAGLLCVRKVRGGRNASNHSWGTAIDITMRNPATGRFVLDPRGDGMVQIGCLELYKHFKADALESGDWVFWGAGFPTEDGMHFEASNELVLKWGEEGKSSASSLNVTPQSSSSLSTSP
jgi:hypothetical protein